MFWIWLLACTSGDSATDDSPCSEQPLVEIAGEIPDGWTTAAGCESVCKDTDGGGLVYNGCYLTSEGGVVCQFQSDCP